MKIKQAWKDYVELVKMSAKWLKNYWLLYLIFCIIYGTVLLIIWNWDYVIYKIKKIKRKIFKE